MRLGNPREPIYNVEEAVGVIRWILDHPVDGTILRALTIKVNMGSEERSMDSLPVEFPPSFRIRRSPEFKYPEGRAREYHYTLFTFFNEAPPQ